MSLPSVAEIRACLAAPVAWQAILVATELARDPGHDEHVMALVADYCEERARQIAQMIAHAEGRP